MALWSRGSGYEVVVAGGMIDFLAVAIAGGLAIGHMVAGGASSRG